MILILHAMIYKSVLLELWDIRQGVTCWLVYPNGVILEAGQATGQWGAKFFGGVLQVRHSDLWVWVQHQLLIHSNQESNSLDATKLRVVCATSEW